MTKEWWVFCEYQFGEICFSKTKEKMRHVRRAAFTLPASDAKKFLGIEMKCGEARRYIISSENVEQVCPPDPLAR